jgi:hypothetical protein
VEPLTQTAMAAHAETAPQVSRVACFVDLIGKAQAESTQPSSAWAALIGSPASSSLGPSSRLARHSDIALGSDGGGALHTRGDTDGFGGDDPDDGVGSLSGGDPSDGSHLDARILDDILGVGDRSTRGSDSAGDDVGGLYGGDPSTGGSCAWILARCSCHKSGPRARSFHDCSSLALRPQRESLVLRVVAWSSFDLRFDPSSKFQDVTLFE